MQQNMGNSSSHKKSIENLKEIVSGMEKRIDFWLPILAGMWNENYDISKRYWMAGKGYCGERLPKNQASSSSSTGEELASPAPPELTAEGDIKMSTTSADLERELALQAEKRAHEEALRFDKSSIARLGYN